MMPRDPLHKELKQVIKNPLSNAWEKLAEADKELIGKIRQTTQEKNRNNVTRTQAYLDFYQKHEEIHWALLAHLVSRNAGWNMTDLRGELLGRLLSHKEQTDFFLFLERGNWLIFFDAYPQLLLYEDCVRRQTNLFHLLPHLQVSSFMQAVWNQFWKAADREQLAACLIVNEQHYLEQHVMHESAYQKTVLRAPEFQLQEWLQLNQILLPCQQEAGPPRLIGHTVSHFASLTERIALGKRLYALLFRDSANLTSALEWAASKPHTGSRKDFWPHLFHDLNESVPGSPYKKKLEHCQLKHGARRLFSPILRHAWKPVDQEQPSSQDWFRGQDVLSLMAVPEGQRSGEIEEAYCRTLAKIELAVIAHGKFNF